MCSQALGKKEPYPHPLYLNTLTLQSSGSETKHFSILQLQIGSWDSPKSNHQAELLTTDTVWALIVTICYHCAMWAKCVKMFSTKYSDVIQYESYYKSYYIDLHCLGRFKKTYENTSIGHIFATHLDHFGPVMYEHTGQWGCHRGFWNTLSQYSCIRNMYITQQTLTCWL